MILESSGKCLENINFFVYTVNENAAEVETIEVRYQIDANACDYEEKKIPTLISFVGE